MSELRERKSKASEKPEERKTPLSGVPSWLQPYLEKIVPYISKIGLLIDIVSPFVNKLQKVAAEQYKKIEPYHPDLVLPMLFGLVLIFFGGYFVTLIACIEAFRIAGWDHVKHGLTCLWSDYQKFHEVSSKDDTVDDNNDGIPDVQQISGNELLTRKLKLFLKSCDPVQVSEALSGIYTGLVGVLATLKLQFARTITLGSTIGDVIYKPTQKYLHPLLASVVPEDYQKWIDVILSYGCKSIGVSIAWSLKRIISSLHSAMRGAQIFCAAFAIYMDKLGHHGLAAGYWDEVFVAFCAIFGFWYQLSSWYTLPWFLYPFLFPLVLAEKILTYVVAFA